MLVNNNDARPKIWSPNGIPPRLTPALECPDLKSSEVRAVDGKSPLTCRVGGLYANKSMQQLYHTSVETPTLATSGMSYNIQTYGPGV